MFDVQWVQYAILTVSVTLLVAQLCVADKQTIHILFALFCASVALSTVKKITGDSVGSYQYLIGMGACATCNVYWLMTRTLFRPKNPFSAQHVVFALLIAFLIMARQGQMMADSLWGIEESINQFARGIISELTVMLSSCVLVMSCWETIRGYSSANASEKAQRMVLLVSLFSAIAICKVVFVLSPDNAAVQQLVVGCVTVAMLVITQVMVVWHSHSKRQQAAKVVAAALAEQQNPEHDEDTALAPRVKKVLIEQQLFLQPNLKVANVAKVLDEPEYKISRVLRNHFDARHFNQFINELRIEHAKTLLADADKQHWPVLVVGLESGFASVGPFTRAFKQLTGSTPNQYRKAHCQGDASVVMQ